MWGGYYYKHSRVTGGITLYFRNLVGPILLSAAAAALFLLMPRERIRRLLPFGIVFGAGLGVVLIAVMQELLGYWEFRQIDFLTARGIPLSIAFTWLPVEVLFAHYLVELRRPESRFLLWFIIGAAVVIFQHLFILNGMLIFRDWTLLDSAFLALALHLGLVVVLHLMGHIRLPDLLKH